MYINNVAPVNTLNANHSTARQLLSLSNQQSANPFFRRDILNLGSTSSPYQTYTALTATSQGSLRDNILDAISQARTISPAAFSATPTALSGEPFSIRSYYAMPPEDVAPMLDNLAEELRNTSFSGMTAAEIYDYVENKYAETFGKDFMAGYYLMRIDTSDQTFTETDVNSSNFMYVKIGLDFDLVVGGCIYRSGAMGPNDSVWDINRERLYGNMTNGEIMDALKAKYPQPMTNRSLCLMAGELWSIGLMDLGVGNYMKAHTVRFGEHSLDSTLPSWAEREERWNAMLDRPANISLLGAIHNVSLRDKETSKNPFVQQTRDLLVKLGVATGSDGYFTSDLSDKLLLLLFGIASDDLASLLDGLRPSSKGGDEAVDDFLEHLEQHDESLREASEEREKNQNLRTEGEEQCRRIRGGMDDVDLDIA